MRGEEDILIVTFQLAFVIKKLLENTTSFVIGEHLLASGF